MSNQLAYVPSHRHVARLDRLTESGLRFSLVIVLAWIGTMKFTTYEAGAIEGLVASSPLMAWLYLAFSQQGVFNLIGVIEILTAVALAIGGRFLVVGVLGAAAAVATFAITVSFILSAPGWESTLGGFPALSVLPGQFLVKDIVLLAVAVRLLASALRRTGFVPDN